MEKEYRHLGYFNDKEDIQELMNESGVAILGYYHAGYGKFYRIDETETVPEKLITTSFGEDDIIRVGKYLITLDIFHENDIDDFIDIYYDEDETLRINPLGEEELIEICLDKAKTPIAWEERVQDLMTSGLNRTEAEREAYNPIQMEVYFQKGQGLFMVETEAVESTDIFSPYTKERYLSPEEDNPDTY